MNTINRFGGPIKAVLALPATALTLLLGGCYMHDPEIVGSIPDDVRITHPISLTEQLVTFDLPVGPSTVRLSQGEAGNVAAFGQRFVESGSGVIAVAVPSGSGNQAAASRLSRDVGNALVGAGVPARAISYRSYPAPRGEPNAPIRIVYVRNGATTAGCGLWRDQIGQSAENKSYAAFGCATQANMAAMVTNPLDLAYPRGSTPASPDRRTNVVKKYENGEAYQSDLSRATGGQVATGVGQ